MAAGASGEEDVEEEEGDATGPLGDVMARMRVLATNRCPFDDSFWLPKGEICRIFKKQLHVSGLTCRKGCEVLRLQGQAESYHLRAVLQYALGSSE